MKPTIPAPNMKDGEKLPPVEVDLEDEEQAPPDDTKTEETDKETSGEDTDKDKSSSEDTVKTGEEKDDDGEISFEDFNNAKEGIFSKKKEASKEDKIKEEKTTAADDTKVDDTGRDYSGLSPEETELFKKMGNKTFAHVKPIVLEHKRLKEEMVKKEKELADLKVGKVTYPDSIYEHEEAYILTPEYGRLNDNKITAEAVLSHWQKQAVLIRKGKDWQDIVDDGKGGMRLSEPKPATDDDETEVNNNIAFAQRQLSKAEKVHDDFVSNFKGRHKADVDAIKQAEAQYFPDYDKPDHITAAVQKEALEALPPSLRKTALTPLVCKLVGAVRLWQYRYNQATKEKTKTAKIEELVKKNGPKGEETLGGGTKSAKTVPSFSDFQKAKE